MSRGREITKSSNRIYHGSSYLRILSLAVLSGIPSTFAWNPNVRRYESYDLEKGPVFYEAYYPDTADNKFQEKRYFDRGVTLERTVQVPFEYLEAPYRGNNEEEEEEEDDDRSSKYLRSVEISPDRLKGYRRYPAGYSTDSRNEMPSSHLKNKYPIPEKSLLAYRNLFGIQNFPNNNNDPLLSSSGLSGIGFEESNLVRRAIPEYEIPKWNSYETYFDPYRGEVGESPRYPSAPGSSDVVETLRGGNISKRIRDVQPETITDTGLPFRREIPISLDANFEPRYRPTEQFHYFPRNFENSQRNVEADLPVENIFEPRPQVINYIFSKARKTPSESLQKQDTTPRNYGDNLGEFREEMKEEENRSEDKEPKVTSIEISELPKRKTRHHHGEWPKRDYSRRKN